MYQGIDLYTNTEAPLLDQWRLEFGALWPFHGGSTLPDKLHAAPSGQPENMSNAYIAQPFARPESHLSEQRQQRHQAALSGIFRPAAEPAACRQGAGCRRGYWSYSVNFGSQCATSGGFRNRFAKGELAVGDPLAQYNVKTAVGFHHIHLRKGQQFAVQCEVVGRPAYPKATSHRPAHR